jgi:glycosyltransferase involved in cell wall biosynthesis
VVYARRLTLEKNVHTLLRTFRVVKDAVPEAHLILAGPAQDVPFGDFGLQPIAIRLDAGARRLGLSLQDSVQFWRSVSPRALHKLLDEPLQPDTRRRLDLGDDHGPQPLDLAPRP